MSTKTKPAVTSKTREHDTTRPKAMFTPPESPLSRVRWLFLLIAILGVALAVPPILLTTTPWPLRAAALVGLSWLVWYWVRGYRRGGFPHGWEVFEGLVVLATGLAVDAPLHLLSLFYNSLVFRSLYGKRRDVVAVALAYVGAFLGAVAFSLLVTGSSMPLAEILPHVLGMMILAAVFHLVATSLTKHERAVFRERTLRKVGAALTSALHRDNICAVAVEGAQELTKDVPGTRSSIVLGPADKMVISAATGDRAEEIEGVEFDLHDFPDLISTPLLDKRSVEVNDVDPALLREALGFEPIARSAYFVPLLVREELGGVLVVASNSFLPRELKDSMEILGSQTALALERADLTEEIRQQQSEERFRALVQNSSDVVLIVGADGAMVYVSPAVERVLGYAPEDLVGISGWGLMHPDELSEVQDFFVRVLNDPGVALPIELRLRHADGSWRYMESVCNNSLDDPAVGGIVINSRDSTERKRAEEALREAEAKYRTLVEQLPAITYINASDRIGAELYVSPQIESILGVRAEEWTSDPKFWVTLLHPEDRERVKAEVARSYARGEPLVTEYRMYARDGRVKWFRDEAVPVRDGTGRGHFHHGVMLDITERKRAEEKIRQLNENLERRVAERTSQLQASIAELKRTEKALRSSEARHRAVVDTADDAIVTISEDGLIRSFNPGAERTFGYEAKEVVGKPLRMLMPERFRRPHEAGFRRYLRTREAHVVGKGPIELAGLRKGGEEFPVELTLGEMREEGDVLFTGVIRDITERKKAEKRLRASEAELRALFAAMEDVILVLDSEGRYLRIAPTNPSLLYKPPEDLVGKTLYEVFPQEQADTFLERIRHALETQQTVNTEYSLRIGEEEVWFAGSVAPVLEDSVIWVARDITERKRAEEQKARQARQAELRAKVSAALAESGTLRGILQRCMEAVVQHLDAAFARVWTLNEEENVLELQASAGLYTHIDGPHGRVPVGTFKIGLIAQERLPHLTNDVVNDRRVSDGEWAKREGMVSFAGYPLVVENQLVGVMAMFAREPLEDDTIEALASVAGVIAQGIERKRAEEELRTYAARLQQSNRELQEFAYVASHDLQEPLRKVRTFGDRLKAKYADALGEQGRDYLERMDGAASRMQDLIDDLLTLSRVTTQARPFAPVDLREVAQDVVSDLEGRIEQVGGQVEVGELPTVEADRLQMHQLLQNLIGNALKFHREGEAPIVKVHGELLEEREEDLHGNDRAGGRARIVVEDNGIGFDEKYLEQVFVPFQRLHGRAAYEGTGMGLAICRKVVERHGGQITAKSMPGRGAKFIVTLPVKQSEMEEERRR